MFHTVFFWLKTDLSDEDRATFETELRRLVNIDYLVQGHASRVADTAERSGVTDHTFDYSLILQFASMQDHERYQSPDDAAHNRFLETCKDFWQKVTVLDSDPIG